MSTSTVPTSTSTSSTTTSTSVPAGAGDGGLASPEWAPTVLADRDLAVAGGLAMDVFFPDQPGPWPVSILIHGGSWLSGEKESMEGLARELVRHGNVVFNAGYRPLDRGGSFPAAFEEITCAVWTAAAHAPDYGGVADTIVVVGYSAGAHIGSVAVFGSDVFGDACEADRVDAAAFVGVSGPYDSDRFELPLVLMFGSRLADDPDAWAAGNPYTYVGNNPDMDVLLIHGDLDLIVNRAFTMDFHDALSDAEYAVELITYEDAGHFDITDPALTGSQTAEDVARFVRAVAAANR